MRIHSWLSKYLEYLEISHQEETIAKTRGLLRFAFWNHVGRDAAMGDAIPIWADGASKPARVRLIRGKAELLSGVDISKKKDLTVNLGGEVSPMLGIVGVE